MTVPTRAWRVWISEEARSTMITAAVNAHPHETGGVLVGVLAQGVGAGRPWVTKAVEVRSPEAGPTHYEMPAGARGRTVRRLRKKDHRLGYLGDWHSHPIDLNPSCTDSRSIASISVSGDCSRPLLFVLRRVNDGYELDGRQWTGASLRRVRILDSGPLAFGPSRGKRKKSVWGRRASVWSRQ